jgi:uncharacterized surface protein with fasciclin (FAS1) repeats
VAATFITLSVFAAACGSDSKAATATIAPASPATTMAPETTMAPAPAMLQASGPGCSAVPTTGMGSFNGMGLDLAATAASHNPLLTTLVAAVTKAGLVDTLNGPGPFTIFAPVNDAFTKIPADQLSAILADTKMLTSILTYHVVAGSSMSSADLIKAGKVTTVNGKDLTITSDDGALVVNGAKALCMDVHTENATVHIIDTVLVP